VELMAQRERASENDFYCGRNLILRRDESRWKVGRELFGFASFDVESKFMGFNLIKNEVIFGNQRNIVKTSLNSTKPLYLKENYLWLNSH
jgi:hypothetical protein